MRIPPAALLPALLAALLPGCRGSSPAPGEGFGRTFGIDPAHVAPATPPMAEAEALEAFAAWSGRIPGPAALPEVAFVGRVIHVGTTPGVGSGIAVVTQPVLYEVVEALRGTLPGGTAVVHHLVLRAAPGDPSGLPRIDPAVFREGATLLVCASYGPAPAPAAPGDLRLTDAAGAHPTLPATPAVLARARALLR